MEKTRMPTVAAILDIISGPLSLFCAYLTVFAFMDPNVNAILVLSVMGLFTIAGILAIVGGIYALSRKKWGLALAGSIAALFPVVLPGIVAIIFTVRCKKEFRLREHDYIEKISAGLTENVAALLCYLAGWVSGLVFILMERENKFVRFHAMQSIIVFGTLMIVHYCM